MPATQASRRRALELLEATARLGLGQVQRRQQLADEALLAAEQAGDLQLQAEALLARSGGRTPSAHPGRVLADLQRAGLIFAANGLHARANGCRISAAAALCDAGEESEALRLAEQALGMSPVSAMDTVQAHLVATKAYTQMLDLDAALHRLALLEPLARQMGQPQLLLRALHAKALAHLFVHLTRRHPQHFFALPSMPRPTAQPASPTEMLRWLDEAETLDDSGSSWPYLRLGRCATQALLQDDAAAATTLDTLWLLYRDTDPALALRALLSRLLLLLRQGRFAPLLGLVDSGLALALACGLQAQVRALRLSQVHAAEGLGDAALALAAFRLHADAQWRSRRTRSVDTTTTDRPPDLEYDPERAAQPLPAARTLRKLEPAYLRRALQHIEAQLGTPLRVDDVAAHSGVSRRTLETAFVNFKSTTVAAYIGSRRFEKACQALMHTDLAVKDIAASVGWRSASAFSREFQVRMGLQPSEWRRMRQAPGTRDH